MNVHCTDTTRAITRRKELITKEESKYDDNCGIIDKGNANDNDNDNNIEVNDNDVDDNNNDNNPSSSSLTQSLSL